MSAEPGYIVPAQASLDAIHAVEALEQGAWRIALELAPRLGRPGGTVRLLALSMRDHALGMVAESWQAMAAAAASPAERRSKLRTTGPGDISALPWPSGVENEFWYRFGLVGQREESQARSQWLRIEDSVYPKRICLVESCVDHLTWVFFDRSTWRSPQVSDRFAASGRVTQGKFGEAGREYFLRRANELFHWVSPLRGSLTRKVWDDLGAYCGLHDAALTALAERDDVRTAQVVQRLAYTSAVALARQAG